MAIRISISLLVMVVVVVVDLISPVVCQVSICSVVLLPGDSVRVGEWGGAKRLTEEEGCV